AVFVACALQPGRAEARGPSTREERARFIALVQALERDPVAANANTIREQLRDWTIEVPDIRFKACPDLLGDVIGNDYPYSREINLQVVLSGAVLTIENPGDARDDVAVYTAGVEGALRAYEVLVKSTPDAHFAVLDDLIEKRDRGELVDHIARLAKEKCKRSNTLLIAAPIGAAVGLVLALLVSHWFGRRGTPVYGENTPGNISTRTATIFRRIVLICAAYYMLVGIALHFLEPEYDPRFQFMSDYAWGAYGWLMTTTFFVLGLAVLTVAVGVRNVHPSSRSARVGFGLLVIGALFVCLAGVFRGFPLHDVAGAVGIPSLVMAALLLSWSFRSAAGWQAIHPATFLIAVGMFAAVVSMIVDVGMPGLQQRAFLSLLLLWLSIISHRLVRVTAGLVQQPNRRTT
ncbi:MAG TPA: DUF998 domain-containing protein, partial [Gemmatimonadaceae bacterium]|nr:DUF998 domain-containing protein [Gemmatimonadaceae bacterium]